MNENLLPDFGDLFSLQDFIEQCKAGNFSDGDGTGYYSDGRVYWQDLKAIPSDMKRDRVKHNVNFRYVIWFNK